MTVGAVLQMWLRHSTTVHESNIILASTKVRICQMPSYLSTLNLICFLLKNRWHLPALLRRAGVKQSWYLPFSSVNDTVDWIPADGECSIKYLTVITAQIFAVFLMCTAACVFGVILGELQVKISFFGGLCVWAESAMSFQEIYAASNMRVRDMEVHSQ